MSIPPVSLIGWLHTAVCSAAMAAGAAALWSRKGSARHKRWGGWYVHTMLAAQLTALLIYSGGGFGIFHWLAVVALLLVVLGAFAAPRQARAPWSLTALLIYSGGGFGIFHWLAVVALLLVVLGAFAAPRQARAPWSLARQLHGVELLPAHRRRRERGVSAPVRAAVRLADVRRTAALLTMRSMRPSSCSSPPAGPPCWPGVCGGGGRRIRPGWRRRPNHDHRNRDTRHERRARRDVPGPRRAGARPGVDPPDDGGSSAGRGPRRPPPRALGRPARLSSLWRKSRIRLGPGAIEPVH